jgi:hypothetical protein
MEAAKEPQRYILGLIRVDWCKMCMGRPPGLGCACIEEKRKKFVSRQLPPYGETRPQSRFR